MSLTSHLKSKESSIGQYIKQRFRHTARLTKTANLQLREQSIITPLLPEMSDTQYPYSTVGMAIDYRIRYAFSITPYQQLTAWKGAVHLNPQLLEVDALKANNRTKDASLAKADKNSPRKLQLFQRLLLFFKTLPRPQKDKKIWRPYSAELLLDFFENLDRTIAAIQPVGRALDDEAAELTLARYCYLLALFEEVYRSSSYTFGPLMNPEPKRTIDELLAIPQDSWLDEICYLFAAFYNKYASLLSLPHILNPEFQVMSLNSLDRID